MTVGSLSEPTLESVESLLRDELAQGDSVLSTAAPVLRHLLVHGDNPLFSDEVVARTRGLLLDVAGQLLRAQADAMGLEESAPFVAERQDDLVMTLADDPAILAHAHPLTSDPTAALQLQVRCGIDVALSPLLQ